jgi:hypothetical protein
MESTEPVFSKWIIDGLPGFVLGSDPELYRLPFATWPNHYGLRRIKKQSGNRWKLDGVWYSQRQLKKTKRIKVNPIPGVLIEAEPDYHF